MNRWKRADMHLHTRFSGWRNLRLIEAQDSYLSPDRAFLMAKQRGMDFVCFTDHDTIDGALDFLSRHPEQASSVIIGEELETCLPGTAQWFHLGIYEVDERIHEDLVRLKEDGRATMDYLRTRGLLFSLNHPFQSFRTIGAARRFLDEILPLVPAVETCNSASPPSHQPVLEAMLAGRAGGPIVGIGGSDAHTPQRVAAAFTAAPATTKEEFIDSIRQGRCCAGGQALGLGALIGDVYRIIGEYYASLVPTPRRQSALRTVHGLLGTLALTPAVLLGLPAILASLHTARQEWIGRFGPWSEGALVRHARRLVARGR